MDQKELRKSNKKLNYDETFNLLPIKLVCVVVIIQCLDLSKLAKAQTSRRAMQLFKAEVIYILVK